MVTEKIVQMPAPSTPSVEPWKTIIEQAEERAGHRAPMVMCRYDYHDIMTGAYAYSRMEITATGEEPYYRTARIYTDGTGEHVDQCRTDVPAVYGDMDAYTKAMAEGRPVYYVAGEDNADRLTKLGMPAITRGDITDWTPKITDIYHGANLVIVADSTVPGRLGSARIKADLSRIARAVKIVYSEDGHKVSDYIRDHKEDEIKNRFGGGLGDTLNGIYGANTFVDVTEDYYNDIPDKDWAIENLITRGECAMISSAAKAGKSYLMTQLAITMASGGEWLGQFRCKKEPVLYMCGENEINDARRRFKQVFTSMGIEPKKDTCEKIGMFCIDGMIHSVQEIERALINEINTNGYRLLILDPLYCFYEGSEIDDEAAKLFAASIKTICRETKVALVCVHHHSKSGASIYSDPSSRANGSNQLQRAFNTVLDLTEIPNAEKLAELPEGTRAYVFSGKPRQAPLVSVNLLFNYPMWTVDEKKLLPDDAMQKARTQNARGANPNNQKGEVVRAQLSMRVDEAFESHRKTDDVGDYVTLGDIVEAFEKGGVTVSEETVKTRIDRSDMYYRDERNGCRKWVRKSPFQQTADDLREAIKDGKLEVVHTQMELPLTT